MPTGILASAGAGGSTTSGAVTAGTGSAVASASSVSGGMSTTGSGVSAYLSSVLSVEHGGTNVGMFYLFS